MKSKKKRLIPVIAVIIVWAIIISGGYYFYTQYTAAYEQFQQKGWFRFFTDIDRLDSFIDKSADEISSYKPKIDKFNHRIYYQNLTDNQKLVYNAYQYAFDNRLPYIYIEKELLKDSKLDANDIFTIFSLDNTAIQQNISFDNYTYEPTFISRGFFIPITKESNGIVVGVDIFTSERLGKMNKAINELKKVDFNFTEESSEYDKVVEIYKYVQKELVYKDFAEKENGYGHIDFLYDAVFEGKTNCDGYATMFGVLCELNGIKSFDKSFTPEEYEETKEETPKTTVKNNNKKTDEMSVEEDDKSNIGHTWNVVSIDGKWYNVDCTESDEEKENNSSFFINTAVGFEDKLQDSVVDYGYLAPKCGDNLIPFVNYYKSFDDEGITTQLCNSMKNSDNSIIVFAVKNYTEGDENTVLQNLCNTLYIDISFYTTKTKDYELFYVEKYD